MARESSAESTPIGMLFLPVVNRLLLASLLDRAGAVSLALSVRRHLLPAALTVVNYHRVDDPAAASEFDEGVLDATPESFDNQLAALRRHFTIVALRDIREYLRGTPLPPSPALVTFDDGYRDNHASALPILQRHGVTAVFFIATRYVEERRIFWWDRVSWTLKHARRFRFVLTYPIYQDIDLTRAVSQVERRLHRLVKEWAGLDLDRFLTGLSDAADAPWSDRVERELAERLVMTWDLVRELHRAGMDIGSHTRSHRVLASVPASELEAELQGSRSDLERQLGAPVWALSYPVGQSIARRPELRAAVEAAGYQIAFAYGTGLQPLRDFDPLDIRRCPVERQWNVGHFVASLAFPGICGRPAKSSDI